MVRNEAMELRDLEADESLVQPYRHDFHSPVDAFVFDDQSGEDDEDGNKAKVCGRWDKVIFTRVVVCAVAVGLIWLTSLSVCKAVVGWHVVKPDIDTVKYEVTKSFAQASFEKQEHKDCAIRQVGLCNQRMNESYMTAKFERAGKITQNDATLNAVTGFSGYCSELLLNLWHSTDAYVKNGSDCPPVGCSITFNPVSSTCNQSEIDYLQDSFGDLGDVTSPAYFVGEDHEQEVNGIMLNINTNIKARVNYDAEYIANKTGIAAIKIKAILDLNADFLDDIRAPNFTVPLDDLQRAAECMKNPESCKATAGVYYAYHNTTEAIGVIGDKVQYAYNETATQVEDFRNQTVTQVRRIAEILDLMVDSTQFLEDLSQVYGININIGNLNTEIVDWIASQQFELNFLNPVDMEPVKEALKNVTNAVGKEVHKLSNATSQMYNETVEKLKDVNFDINATLPELNAFEDYNPPDLNASIEADLGKYANTTQVFKGKLANALGRFSDIKRDVKINTTIDLSAFSSVLNSSFSANSTSTLQLFKLQGMNEDFDYGTLITALKQLGSIFVILDVLLRCHRSVRIITRFWSKSAYGLPEIDISKTKHKKKEAGGVKVARVLSNKWVLGSIATIFGSIIILAVSTGYAPFYTDYVEGCVEGDRGTFFGKNAFSVAYNLASASGNKELAKGIDHYDKDRAEMCGEQVKSSKQKQINDEAVLIASQATIASSSLRSDVYDRCVDMNTFAGQEKQEFIARHGIEHPSHWLDLLTDECLPQSQQHLDYRLQDQTFTCDVIPTCSFTCNGPDPQRLTTSTRIAMCHVEWWVHAGFLTFTVSILMYISVNISRILFVNAMCRMAHKQLTPQGYTYTATCNGTGEMDNDTEKLLKDEMTKSISSYEKGAYFNIILALLVHVPYIVILRMAQASIQQIQSSG